MILKPDLREAQRFINLLADNQPITFQTFDDGASKNSQLARILHGSLQEHGDTLARFNARGAGVFIMINQGDQQGRKAENVVGVRALFVDLDGSPLESVLMGSVEPHIIVETSPGRFHAYWLVHDCPKERFTFLQAELAKKFNGDNKIKDLSRVMRLPGYWHQKKGSFQTRILQANPALTYGYSVNELMTGLGLDAQPTIHFASKTASPSMNFNCEQPFTGFDQGGRDDGLFRYACSLRGRGIEKDEARLLVLAVAAKCRPPLSEAEATKCLDSAWRYDSGDIERLTDVGNAQRLVRLHRQYLRYIPEFKKWLVWDGSRWMIDEDGEIMRRAKDAATTIYVEAKHAAEVGKQDKADKLASHASKSQSANRLKAMIELAQSEPGMPLRTTVLDQDNYLLCVTNGVINLRTGDLCVPCREDYITKQVQVVYDPTALAPKFIEFLTQIMGGNKALVDFIQRAIGYSLTGDTSEQCLFFLYGSGANGKSTLLNVVRELLGDYGMQCPAETLMVKQGGGNVPNDIARLRGARFVATSEIEDGRRFAESMIKQLTGQDTIAARFLFAEFFEFVPKFKIWLGANHKPVIRGDDQAIWRRIRLIPFAFTIPQHKRDKNLTARLKNEFPGIIAWAIQGCLKWQQQGLNPPPEVLAATDEYKSEMDLIGKWIDECCDVAPHASAQASTLYGSYKHWVEDNGGFPLSSTKLGLKLSERGFRKEKSGNVFYYGIGMLDTPDSWKVSSRSSQDNPYISDFPEKPSKPSRQSNNRYLAASRGE